MEEVEFVFCYSPDSAEVDSQLDHLPRDDLRRRTRRMAVSQPGQLETDGIRQNVLNFLSEYKRNKATLRYLRASLTCSGEPEIETWSLFTWLSLKTGHMVGKECWQTLPILVGVREVNVALGRLHYLNRLL